MVEVIPFAHWQRWALFPKFERFISRAMQVIAVRTLTLFWQEHPAAEVPLRTWYSVPSKAEWRASADIKRQFGTTVDFLGDDRVIFDIGGNKHRLIVYVAYRFKRVLIKFVGTHREYDRIDPETV